MNASSIASGWWNSSQSVCQWNQAFFATVIDLVKLLFLCNPSLLFEDDQLEHCTDHTYNRKCHFINTCTVQLDLDFRASPSDHCWCISKSYSVFWVPLECGTTKAMPAIKSLSVELEFCFQCTVIVVAPVIYLLLALLLVAMCLFVTNNDSSSTCSTKTLHLHYCDVKDMKIELT